MAANKGITDDQIITALSQEGSQAKAAQALGINVRTLERRVQGLTKRGWSPQHDMTRTVPDGYAVKGTSTLYREDGTIAAQWVKSMQDADRMRAILEEAFAGMGDDLPRVKAIKAPAKTSDELLNCFILTDHHLGMLAWGEETRNDDWDLGISERLMVDWFTEAIRRAPKSGTAIFAQLGDFLHFDGLDSVTPEHKNLLDSDTRFAKLVRAAIRVSRQVVNMLLKTHDQVHVLMAEGNHDPASSVWLREWFSAIYEEEPRVTVDTSPDPYYCYEHGKTSLFFHHGHKRKIGSIDAVFAAKFRDVFGRTDHSYAHMGHRHSNEVRDTNLMIIEQHQTLASPDAYASRGGWLNGRSAKVITYSKEHGEVGRVVLTPAAVAGASSIKGVA